MLPVLLCVPALSVGGAGASAAEAPVYEEAPVYAPAPATQAQLRFAGLRRNRGNGRGILFVRVSEPGRLFVWGRGARPFRRSTARAGRVRLLVLPRAPLKRYLKRHGKGRIRVNVAFEPFSGAAGRVFERPVLLKRKKRRR